MWTVWKQSYQFLVSSNQGVKGPKGEQGEDFIAVGKLGEQGKQGKDGDQGEPGINGDKVSVMAMTTSISALIISITKF